MATNDSQDVPAFAVDAHDTPEASLYDDNSIDSMVETESMEQDQTVPQQVNIAQTMQDLVTELKQKHYNWLTDTVTSLDGLGIENPGDELLEE